MADDDRLFEPEEMIAFAVELVGKMRVRHGDDEKAVNAAMYMMMEGMGWLVVRSSKTAEQSGRVALQVGDMFLKYVHRLEKTRHPGEVTPAEASPEASKLVSAFVNWMGCVTRGGHEYDGEGEQCKHCKAPKSGMTLAQLIADEYGKVRGN